MGKIILNKRQAEDLEYILKQFTREEVLQGHLDALKDNKPHKNVYYQFLNDFSIVQISKMLFEGYEVKKEPKDIILENYKLHKELLGNEFIDNGDYYFSLGYLEGMKNTLEALDVKIGGLK